MTKEKAREVIMRTLESVDKAVGVGEIRPSQEKDAFIVDLMKHRVKFRVTIDQYILTVAEADLIKHLSGHEGDSTWRLEEPAKTSDKQGNIAVTLVCPRHFQQKTH